MKHCAFLTMDSLEEFECYDHLLVSPLKDRGWEVDMISWRAVGVEWDKYDVVLIRSPWDYQSDSDAFMKVLGEIEQSKAKLENSLEICHWNVHKAYLLELEMLGVAIVPTVLEKNLRVESLYEAFEKYACSEIIVKPPVSANADNTFRLTKEKVQECKTELIQIFSEEEYLLQPFIDSIVNEGEYSLFYFAGEYSHAILKKPKSGDFRVQEEHGGQLLLIDADEKLKTVASHVLKFIPGETMYARIDLVSHEGEYLLMEVELIEPSLYFNMDAKAAERFADAFVKRLGDS